MHDKGIVTQTAQKCEQEVDTMFSMILEDLCINPGFERSSHYQAYWQTLQCATPAQGFYRFIASRAATRSSPRVLHQNSRLFASLHSSPIATCGIHVIFGEGMGKSVVQLPLDLVGAQTLICQTWRVKCPRRNAISQGPLQVSQNQKKTRHK